MVTIKRPTIVEKLVHADACLVLTDINIITND